MILLESAEQTERSLDRRLILASQLAARGHPVAISAASLGATALSSHRRYQIEPFLADQADLRPEVVLVLADAAISTGTLAGLRSYRLDAEVRVVALGRFATAQARIDCQARIAYAIGREPQTVNVGDWQAFPPIPAALLPLAGVPSDPRPPGQPVRLTVVLAPDAPDIPDVVATLTTLGHMRTLAVRVLGSREQKTQLGGILPFSVLVAETDELAPASWAAQSDVVVLFGPVLADERIGALALDMMVSGKVVIDATSAATLAGRGAPALRGPESVAALLPYLQTSVLPQLPEIERQVGLHSWRQSHSFARLEAALGLEERPGAAPQPGRTVFLPTNGVGLGHARRCLMLAEAMSAPAHSAFAAFPSCAPLIEERGYACLPLVPRSDAHEGWHAHDLVNYRRLRRSLLPGDHFVFDGGYVFESVYKTILEKNLAAVWIRRGLWQASQITSKTLRRENVFRRIIVPGEAFDELNDDYSFGPSVARVGPIVQTSPSDTSGLRVALAERFDHPVRELVVTMLGGGVAADRSAQLHLLAAVLEQRPSCLHLVVVWPGSRVASGLHSLRNTRVVQTRQALELCRAADLVVSAAGYNSFHECLYHAIPAIFIPQMAPYMDDQERRARAASDRGLAETVLAGELLRLERTVAACLDGGRAADLRSALAAVDLPATGTAAAAALIGAVQP